MSRRRRWTNDDPRVGWSKYDGVSGSSHADPPPESKPPETDYVLDEKSGLYLPEGARTRKQPAGFSAEWKTG